MARKKSRDAKYKQVLSNLIFRYFNVITKLRTFIVIDSKVFFAFKKFFIVPIVFLNDVNYKKPKNNMTMEKSCVKKHFKEPKTVYLINGFLFILNFIPLK